MTQAQCDAEHRPPGALHGAESSRLDETEPREQRQDNGGEPVEEKSSCKIRRPGIVLELNGPWAVLEIEGRTVRVPAGKIAAGTAPGTPVQWDGSRWAPVS